MTNAKIKLASEGDVGFLKKNFGRGCLVAILAFGVWLFSGQNSQMGVAHQKKFRVYPNHFGTELASSSSVPFDYLRCSSAATALIWDCKSLTCFTW